MDIFKRKKLPNKKKLLKELEDQDNLIIAYNYTKKEMVEIPNSGNRIYIQGKVNTGKSLLARNILSELIIGNENSLSIVLDPIRNCYDFYPLFDLNYETNCFLFKDFDKLSKISEAIKVFSKINLNGKAP